MMQLMALRRILACVVLLVITTGFLLPHWHKDWNEQGCQLCHVRNLPSLHSPVAIGPARPIATERDWQSERPVNEVEVFLVQTSSRAPPATLSFFL
jgi:hypothetical protein